VVATRKITITLPEEDLEQVKELARKAGLPLSTWIAQTLEHDARIQAGLEAMREWQDEHGVFTEEELAWADAQIAAADAQHRSEGKLAG
jgi:cytosine/adenosine deaminase-related metal-dependent hydrolase